jgi:hypothetical protein
MRRAVRAWLKAGVMEDGKLSQRENHTSRVSFPLLANVTLHGLEARQKFI